MNTNDPPLNQLFTEARLHQPFGEPSSFGFETRLRAALAKATPGFAEVFAILSWRFAAASLPIALSKTATLTPYVSYNMSGAGRTESNTAASAFGGDDDQLFFGASIKAVF